ncbi:MAG: MFS transporter [Oscillospiraceae bacterium]|nr:MFS transporter [Oscillospiraceae bacterium]
MKENANAKKPIGFGFRGWMLILFQAIAYITYQVFTQYPLNILSDFYGGATVVSKYYSICAIVGIFIQILLIGPISRLKSLKNFCCTLGAITMVLALGVMFAPAGALWFVCYSLINVTSVLYATMTLGLLVGQWFPTRKGSVMGIATLAFPIANGLLGLFAGSVFGGVAPKVAEAAGALMASDPAAGGAAFALLEAENVGGAAVAAGVNATPFIMKAFLPFFIVSLIGLIIGIVFIKDYPEQVGAYRDNDKSMTPELANAIMMAEIENKKTSVWTIPNTIKSKEFWFSTLTNALLLGTAIGLMSQSQAIFNNAMGAEFYSAGMGMIMIFGMLGSFILGLLDNRIGTRKAMMISTALMIIAGILGIVSGASGVGALIVPAMIFVALFMGAASNFGVSCAAQYWRREDFGRIFMLSSPIGSLISSAAPMVVAGLLFGAMGYKGPSGVFTLVLICGVVAFVAMLLFSPAAIKAQDDKYRKAAGKEADDALAGRK